MTTPRKHHYVQQAHLALFADARSMLFVASKEGKKFQSGPKGVFAVRDLYSYDADEGVITGFESALSEFEGGVFPFIREIAEDAALTHERIEAARIYMACSMLRNPAYQRMIMENLRANLETSAILMDRQGKFDPFPTTGSELDGKSMTELLRDKDIEFTINNSEYLRAFQGMLVDSVKLLGGFAYSLLIADAGDVAIGDHPFTFVHPGVEFGPYGTPLGGKDCEIAFPISRNVVLIGRWEAAFPDMTSPAAVRQANIRQAMFASNFLASAAPLAEAGDWLRRYRELSFTSDVAKLPAGDDGFYILTRRGLLPSNRRAAVGGDIVSMETFSAGAN